MVSGIFHDNMPEFTGAGVKLWSVRSAEVGSWPACAIRCRNALSQLMCIASAASVEVLEDTVEGCGRACVPEVDAVMVGIVA